MDDNTEGAMNEDVRRAAEIAEAGIREAKGSAQRAHGILRRALERALQHLEEGEQAHSSDPEDITAALDRRSKEIAEDLRRAERLMRERTGGQ